MPRITRPDAHVLNTATNPGLPSVVYCRDCRRNVMVGYHPLALIEIGGGLYESRCYVAYPQHIPACGHGIVASLTLHQNHPCLICAETERCGGCHSDHTERGGAALVTTRVSPLNGRVPERFARLCATCQAQVTAARPPRRVTWYRSCYNCGIGGVASTEVAQAAPPQTGTSEMHILLQELLILAGGSSLNNPAALTPLYVQAGTVSTGARYYCGACRDEARGKHCAKCDKYTVRDGSRCPGIHDYSYKPAAKFIGKESAGTPFFGTELEVETCDDRSTVALAIEGMFGDKVYVKHDGSLYHGMELVTHPVAFSHLKQVWTPERMYSLESELHCHAEDTCGMHVHISRAPFHAKPAMWLSMMFWHYHNRAAMEKIAGRVNAHYAQMVNVSVKEVGDWAVNSAVASDHSPYMPYGRHSWINTGVGKTFEMRYFSSTLDWTTLHARYQFLRALIESTAAQLEGEATGDSVRVDAYSLIQFAMDRASRFPEFITKIPEWFGDVSNDAITVQDIRFCGSFAPSASTLASRRVVVADPSIAAFLNPAGTADGTEPDEYDPDYDPDDDYYASAEDDYPAENAAVYSGADAAAYASADAAATSSLGRIYNLFDSIPEVVNPSPIHTRTGRSWQ